jgi:hypothetical protein
VLKEPVVKQPAEKMGRGGLDISVSGGIQGAVGNPLAQDDMHMTTMNPRFDTCFETNCCCLV